MGKKRKLIVEIDALLGRIYMLKDNDPSIKSDHGDGHHRYLIQFQSDMYKQIQQAQEDIAEVLRYE